MEALDNRTGPRSASTRVLPIIAGVVASVVAAVPIGLFGVQILIKLLYGSQPEAGPGGESRDSVITLFILTFVAIALDVAIGLAVSRLTRSIVNKRGRDTR